MRNPTKRRTASTVVAAIGAVALATTIVVNRGRSPIDGAWFAIVIASSFVILFAIVGIITYHVHVRWIARLNRGHRRLAQWTLSAAEWEQFRTNDKAWRDTGRPNSLKLRKDGTASNVAVIIAQDALMVDDDFYHLGTLRGLQWIPETPPSLEYNMVTVTKNGSVKWNIRLPVAAGADAQARAVWDYVHRPVSFDVARSIRRFRYSRVAGLVVAALSGFALIYTRAYYVNEVASHQLWYFVGGAVGLPVGLLVAAVCHWQLQVIARESRNRGKRSVE